MGLGGLDGDEVYVNAFLFYFSLGIFISFFWVVFSSTHC